MKTTHNKNEIEIEVMKTQLSQIFDTLTDLKKMLQKNAELYATKVELLNATSELRQDYTHMLSNAKTELLGNLALRREKIDHELEDVSETINFIRLDIENKEKDRRRLIWIIVSTAIPSIFSLILTILSKLEILNI